MQHRQRHLQWQRARLHGSKVSEQQLLSASTAASAVVVMSYALASISIIIKRKQIVSHQTLNHQFFSHCCCWSLLCIAAAISFILHLDKHLSAMIQQHGAATYAILWGIVFCETGLVLTPFLPGDSLLFAAGAFAGVYMPIFLP